MVEYHDLEWGVPLHDDRKLFEFMILDAMQAGLSWRTVLYKREEFERSMHGFDVVRISKYRERDVERLMTNAGIIRNRQKIEASVLNARGVLAVQEELVRSTPFCGSSLTAHRSPTSGSARARCPSPALRRKR